MFSHKVSALVICLVASMLVACGKDAPKCSDPETLKLARSIFVDQLGGASGVSEADLASVIKFNLPRATGYDEKIKKYGCEAQIVIDESITYPASYESQLDDKGDHIVMLSGMSRRDQQLLGLAVLGGLAKLHPEKAEPKPPAISAVPKSFSGTWKGDLEGEGEMTIKQSAQGPEVSINVAAPNCGGTITGVATPASNGLKLTQSEGGAACTISITFSGDSAVLEEDNCSYYHGAACGFSGTLKRQN